MTGLEETTTRIVVLLARERGVTITQYPDGVAIEPLSAETVRAYATELPPDLELISIVPPLRIDIPVISAYREKRTNALPIPDAVRRKLERGYHLR